MKTLLYLRRLALTCALLVVTWIGFGVSSNAKYRLPETENVPIARLVENLEKTLKDNPKDVQSLVNLARTHAMAYSLKTDTGRIPRGNPYHGVYFGLTSRLLPFNETVTTDDAGKLKEAAAHLAKAISRYEEALKLDPDNLITRLGHAWVVEQSGKKEQAIKEYRKIVEEAWPKEKEQRSRGLRQWVVVETTSYLKPLLDQDKDKEEIATLTERCEELAAKRRVMSPIVIPLRDGLRASDLEDRLASVPFDVDGSGLKGRWSWVTKDAGWLVYDPKGKGEITSGLQLFGNVTFWLFWENGYHALAALDDNGDGILSGKELAGLAIWHDANGNGICDPGEVKPLSAYGIVGLRCRYEIDRNHPDKIAFAPQGVIYKDGKTRPSFDLILHKREGKSAVGLTEPEASASVDR